MEPDENRDRTAADQSSDFAAQDMASMLDYGQEHRAYRAIEKGDYGKARRLLEPVAARGSIYSLLTLGGFYEWGRLGAVDLNLAASYYERAAIEGSDEAHRLLGRVLYDLGEKEKARAAFRYGADVGNVSCMYWLGNLEIDGCGGVADVNQGTEWLVAAAEQGHIFAKRDLLVLEIRHTKSVFEKLLKQFQIVALAKDAIKEAWRDASSDKIR